MQSKALHVGIIMDGNGRWATARGLPRESGHRAGTAAARRIVERAPDLGVATLTLYAFSADNWRRPPAEVAALMALLRVWLRRERRRLVAEGVRLSVIGRRDRVAPALVRAIEQAEAASAGGDRLHLRIALDYSSRDAIVRAAAIAVAGGAPTDRDGFGRLIAQASGDAGGAPDVDLLIRSGGEQRLSDFLLWECAYAELWFTDRLWPDMTEADLAAALAAFRGRERRFGGLGAGLPAVAAPMR